MDDGSDVAQAFRVCSMAMGIEHHISKIDSTTFSDCSDKSVTSDGLHTRSVDVPSAWVGSAVSYKNGAEIEGFCEIGFEGQPVPFKMTIHEAKKRRKAPRGRLSVKVGAGLFLFEQESNPEHACSVRAQEVRSIEEGITRRINQRILSGR